jgi:hypothetical protein
MSGKKKSHHEDPDVGPYNKKITGRELSLPEEISIRLDTLVELLQDKGIISKREYVSRVAFPKLLRLKRWMKNYDNLDRWILGR